MMTDIKLIESNDITYGSLHLGINVLATVFGSRLTDSVPKGDDCCI